MRLATSASFLLQAAGVLSPAGGPMPATFVLLSIASAVLLLAGLWTPMAGAGAALAAAWHGWVHPSAMSADALLVILGVALALLGPGAWSMDARLFGWKRLELQNGSNPDTSPDSRPDRTI